MTIAAVPSGKMRHAPLSNSALGIVIQLALLAVADTIPLWFVLNLINDG